MVYIFSDHKTSLDAVSTFKRGAAGNFYDGTPRNSHHVYLQIYGTI